MLFTDGFRAERIKTSGAEINLMRGGDGPPLLLLHGFPQTHAMWHRVAPILARDYTVVCPDLRGYGDSATLVGAADHGAYAKREMGRDMIEVMAALGHSRFHVAGHDRGARVTHRLALDHGTLIRKACVMDIVPTRHVFRNTDQALATAYYHWFFLIQPDGLPERMIGHDPAYYLSEKLRRWAAPGARFDPAACAEYIRCFSRANNIHAACEDYRAAATIDLVHDEADRTRRIGCPLLVLWGSQGFVHRHYDVLSIWREHAVDVRGRAIDCGHFLPEEKPAEVAVLLREFFAD